MRCTFSLHPIVLAGLLAASALLLNLTAADLPPAAEPAPAQPPPAAEPAPTDPPAPAAPADGAADAPKPDELPVGDDVKPSVYKNLPKPFQSKKAGEPKPMLVWYDAKTRRVYLEGKFCLAEGGIEFLAVAEGGKVHESLLEIACRPQDLLYAMLVCTYECNNNLNSEGESVVPAGDPVFVYVEFQKDGKTCRHRIENFANNRLTGKSMMKISFAFTGSNYTKDPQTGKSVYMADMEKDLITCFRTAWSVFNTPLLQGNNDSVYSVNKDLVPARGTECVVVITRGLPIDKNAIDDSADRKGSTPDGQGGKAMQFAEQGKVEGADDFAPLDPQKDLTQPPTVTP